jgi:hypothetical protein
MTAAIVARLSPRQRNLVNRLRSGETIFLGALGPCDKDAAWRLQSRGIIDFTPTTCHLRLTNLAPAPPPDIPFLDGSRAVFRSGRWIVAMPAQAGLASIGCLAADWAAAANRGGFKAPMPKELRP